MGNKKRKHAYDSSASDGDSSEEDSDSEIEGDRESEEEESEEGERGNDSDYSRDPDEDLDEEELLKQRTRINELLRKKRLEIRQEQLKAPHLRRGKKKRKPEGGEGGFGIEGIGEERV